MTKQQIFVEAVSKRDGSLYLKPMGKPRRVLHVGVYAEYIRSGQRCFAKLCGGVMIDQPWMAYKIVA